MVRYEASKRYDMKRHEVSKRYEVSKIEDNERISKTKQIFISHNFGRGNDFENLKR